VNYIKEINAFYDWLETNQLSQSDIVLWHALMHINNKSGWKAQFTVAISVLEVKTGLTRRTIERARNRLYQVGLIDWKSRKGNRASLYELKSLCGNYDAQKAVKNDVESDAQGVAQPVDITKRNETKQKEEEVTRENPVTVYEQNFGIMKPLLQESFLAWCNDLGDDVVIAAMKLAVHKGGRTFSYVESILKEWINEGLDDLNQIRTYEENKKKTVPFRKQKQQKTDSSLFDELRKEGGS